MRRLAGTPLQLRFDFDSLKELLQLASHDALSVKRNLDELAFSGIGDIKPLSGSRDYFRLRVGQVRVEFYVEPTVQLLVVVRVFYRQEGYKTKGRSRRK
jgi:mRNA-degrading endonuclease RelE of RelBE toxin-antitoxin system